MFCRILAFIFAVLLDSTSAAQNLTKHVNPFIGAGGHGHTYPGATLPFGMVQLSPDTRVEGWDGCSGYHYSDSTIIGFSHTHLSGTGVADYGDILFMPTVGKLQIVAGDEKIARSGFRSKFRHAKETATAGYYSVHLDDYNIQVELTATERVGFHRYVFPKTDSANIIIDLQHGIGPDRALKSNLQIIGDAEIAGMRRSEGWAKDQIIYFVAQFSKPFRGYGIAIDDTIHPNQKTASGKNIKSYFRFSTIANETILAKVGISAVSVDGARKNIQAEIPDWNFARVKVETNATWNKELRKIEVTGGTPEQLITFYTALYHALITPNLYSDVDGQYRGRDGKAHASKNHDRYTVFSLWDTFRAEHPLLTIIDQKRTRDFIKTFLAQYDEGGILPVWELAANERWCMIGYHAAPVIVDAYMKGIRGFDAEKAFAAMKHSAGLNHFGLPFYRERGYIPAEKEAESVSKTLEYAYDDWCIAQMAKALGKQHDYEIFSQRAQYYKNIFDAATGFARAKELGRWIEPFDPLGVTNHYTEANAWQYNFFAPQDVEGMIETMGGKEKFIQKLDQLFTGDSRTIGRQQADITGMIGQYAQGNEPSHHVAYLYNYAGAPWKTQHRVRQIMDSLYTARPDGLCGNDDCGQLSAWYVMSAMGFYPVTPGQPLYCIGSPLFEQVKLHLENGRWFAIKTQNNSRTNFYIQSARLNGQNYTKSFLLHEDVMRGGELILNMGSQPNMTWASKPDGTPHSLPLQPMAAVPHVVAPSKTFVDSMQIALACNTAGAEIHYTTNGQMPTANSSKYVEPITLRNTTTLKAFAVKTGMTSSKIVVAEFEKRQPAGKIFLNTKYSFQYTGGGDNALLDGIRGGADFRLGAWQGYEGIDLDAVVDLGHRQKLEEIALRCLQDNNSWIFFPPAVEFSFSDDAFNFHDAVAITNDALPQDMKISIKNFGARLQNIQARYVRVHAKSMGLCPEWHKGAGGKAWLFVDEIIINTK